MKYERTMNELDDAKRKLVNQHEEDLEQMMTMKKQMEKKLNEAYEEVDDQKRDSAQWKNKYKKAQVNGNIKAKKLKVIHFLQGTKTLYVSCFAIVV